MAFSVELLQEALRYCHSVGLSNYLEKTDEQVVLESPVRLYTFCTTFSFFLFYIKWVLHESSAQMERCTHIYWPVTLWSALLPLKQFQLTLQHFTINFSLFAHHFFHFCMQAVQFLKKTTLEPHCDILSGCVCYF